MTGTPRYILNRLIYVAILQFHQTSYNLSRFHKGFKCFPVLPILKKAGKGVNLIV